MITVVGTGYTGARILGRLPGAIGISRSPVEGVDPKRILRLDLDGDIGASIPVGDSVIYTVPPAAGSADPRLVRFLAALGEVPRRFVYLSTTGVYGDHEGGLVSERTPAVPETDRARRRLAAEQLVLSWAQDHAVEAVILRVPGIYGPGRLGTDRVRSGEPQLAEAEVGPGNRIHVDDLVEACILAAEPGAASGVFNVGDGDHRSSTWFTQEVARQLGAPPLPEISREKAQQAFSAMRLSFLNESRLVDTARIREALNFMPRYADASEGIRASLKEECATD